MIDLGGLYNRAGGIVNKAREMARGIADPIRSARQWYVGFNPQQKNAVMEQVKAEFGDDAWNEFEKIAGG